MTNENVKHIEVEQMLFGDWRVQVWDEHLNSALDREYFCRGMRSAFQTAVLVKKDLFPELSIFLRSGSLVRKVEDYELESYETLRPTEGE